MLLFLISYHGKTSVHSWDSETPPPKNMVHNLLTLVLPDVGEVYQFNSSMVDIVGRVIPRWLAVLISKLLNSTIIDAKIRSIINLKVHCHCLNRHCRHKEVTGFDRYQVEYSRHDLFLRKIVN